MSDLAQFLIRDAKIHHSTRLDLGNSGLVFLPKELFELTWLEELYLGSEGEFYDYDKKEIVHFKTQNKEKANCLVSLDFPISPINIIKSLPPSWEKLVNLKILGLRGNGEGKEFRHIDALKQLNNLQQLDISNLWIRDLRPLRYLKRLRRLNITGTEIEDVSLLENLKKLELITDNTLLLRKFNQLNPKQNMTPEKLKETIHDLISNAKTEKALKVFKNWAHQKGDEDLKSAVSQLSNQLNGLNRKINMGLLSNSESTIQNNQITSGVLGLLKTLNSNNTALSSTNYTKIHDKTPISKERKTLKIFLASSNELKADRDAFELHFGARKRKTFVHDIEVVLWEDFIDAMSRTRLQDEYNKAVQECDIFVMLFFTKVGQYTAEEFETAFGHFQENGSPLIYTYFKNAAINTADISNEMFSLLKFKDQLNELGHFYTQYKDTNDLNFRFSNQLDKLLKAKKI